MSERKIDEATMDNVEILAKLALTPQERQKAMDEMEKILTYVEKLNELDTDQAEPLVHILPDVNVFREDEVTNGDGRKDSLANAPKAKEDQYNRTEDRIAGGRSNGRNLTDVCAGTVKTDPDTAPSV